MFYKSVYSGVWLPTLDKTASDLDTSVTTSLGVDTSTEVICVKGGGGRTITIYPCLFQIRTSAPSSGTVLTFDKVKLLSLSTCDMLCMF